MSISYTKCIAITNKKDLLKTEIVEIHTIAKLQRYHNILGGAMNIQKSLHIWKIWGFWIYLHPEIITKYIWSYKTVINFALAYTLHTQPNTLAAWLLAAILVLWNIILIAFHIVNNVYVIEEREAKNRSVSASCIINISVNEVKIVTL